jgi:hypothetical protein
MAQWFTHMPGCGLKGAGMKSARDSRTTSGNRGAIEIPRTLAVREATRRFETTRGRMRPPPPGAASGVQDYKTRACSRHKDFRQC